MLDTHHSQVAGVVNAGAVVLMQVCDYVAQPTHYLGCLAAADQLLSGHPRLHLVPMLGSSSRVCVGQPVSGVEALTGHVDSVSLQGLCRQSPTVS